MSGTLPTDVTATASNSLLAVACLLLALALPACAFYYLMFSPAHVLAASMGLPPSPALSSPDLQMAASHRVLITAIAIIPAGWIAVALMCARRCFLSFARREYFTLYVVRGLRGFAGAMFLSGVAGLAVAPLVSLSLSALGVGAASVSVNISSSQLLLLLFSGIVWQIAAVMNKAVALADENAQFV